MNAGTPGSVRGLAYTAHFKPLTKPVRQAWVMFPSYRQEIKPRVSTELPTHPGSTAVGQWQADPDAVGLREAERQFSPWKHD